MHGTGESQGRAPCCAPAPLPRRSGYRAGRLPGAMADDRVPLRERLSRAGDRHDRDVAEVVAKGLSELGGNRSLERASAPAATGSWEATSDVGLKLRTNLLASVRSKRADAPARALPLWTTSGVAQPPGFPPVSFVDCPAFGDLSPAQCRSVRQIDHNSETAGAPGRARVVVGLLCERTLPSGSAAPR